MSFSIKTPLPYRLRLMFALLAAGAAGAWLSYAGFRASLKPYSQEANSRYLVSRLELAAVVLEGETRAALQQARLTAARTGVREILTRQNSGGQLAADRSDMDKRLSDAASSSMDISGLDLAGPSGKITASLDARRIGAAIAPAAEFRLAAKGDYTGAPRAELGSYYYDILVSVPALPEKTGEPLGTLRCTFKLGPTARDALNELRSAGFTLAIAKKNGQRMIVAEAGGPVLEYGIKAAEAGPFLAALSGEEGVFRPDGDTAIYGWRPVKEAGWVIAAKAEFPPFGVIHEALLSKTRAWVSLVIALIAAAALLGAGLLCAPLADAGRRAADLLEQCGAPAGNVDLREPGSLAGAIGEAAAMLKKRSSRDLALETEAEKLREEESDLKSQNDELEKLNKYLMEREIKISELKREISDLREKVGGGV